MSWLRTLMWIDLVLGCADLLGQFPLILELSDAIARSRTTGLMWLTPAILVSVIVPLGLPVMLIVFSIGLLQRRAGARVGLMVYCWAELGMGVLRLFQLYYRFLPGYMSTQMLIPLMRDIGYVTRLSAVPLITLLFITRPQIKTMFVKEDRGFEVLRSDQSP
jgi:hypothetical protein